MLNFGLQILGVKPEDMILLVTEDLFYQIVKQVATQRNQMKVGRQYYL